MKLISETGIVRLIWSKSTQASQYFVTYWTEFGESFQTFWTMGVPHLFMPLVKSLQRQQGCGGQDLWDPPNHNWGITVAEPHGYELKKLNTSKHWMTVTVKILQPETQVLQELFKYWNSVFIAGFVPQYPQIWHAELLDRMEGKGQQWAMLAHHTQHRAVLGGDASSALAAAKLLRLRSSSPILYSHRIYLLRSEQTWTISYFWYHLGQAQGLRGHLVGSTWGTLEDDALEAQAPVW